MFFSLSRLLSAKKRTGLHPDRKRGPWTSLFLYLRPGLSLLVLFGREALNLIFSHLGFSPLVSRFLLLVLCFSVNRLPYRYSFSLVRPVNSKREQKEADGCDRWHPVPLFRGKLEEEVAFKIPSTDPPSAFPTSRSLTMELRSFVSLGSSKVKQKTS